MNNCAALYELKKNDFYDLERLKKEGSTNDYFYIKLPRQILIPLIQ